MNEDLTRGRIHKDHCWLLVEPFSSKIDLYWHFLNGATSIIYIYQVLFILNKGMFSAGWLSPLPAEGDPKSDFCRGQEYPLDA